MCGMVLPRTQTGGLGDVSDQWPWASTAAPETRLCKAVCPGLGNTARATESARLDSDPGSPAYLLFTLGRVLHGRCLSFPSINECDDSSVLPGLL